MASKSEEKASSKKKTKTVTKTAKKKSVAKTAPANASAKKELEETRQQIQGLQEDNAQLKEELLRLEARLEQELARQSAEDSRSWDEKLAHGLCRFSQAWSDYGPIIIIGLFILMIIAWIGPWDGLFTFCFTLLMAWVFMTSLAMAKSNIKNHFDQAVYKIRS